jgi:hypothetical protein
MKRFRKVKNDASSVNDPHFGNFGILTRHTTISDIPRLPSNTSSRSSSLMRPNRADLFSSKRFYITIYMCLNVTPQCRSVLGCVSYCCALLVRENNKRDSYTPHPIAEERILRERRREAPSKKPAMPRSFDCRHDQTTEEGLKRGTDIPHRQDCPSKATVLVFSANLHSCLPNAVNVQLPLRKV